MKVHDWEKKRTIETKFPDYEYDSYLLQAKVSDQSNMSHSQIDVIFLLAREDFKIGKLGLDQFSDICNVLFGIISSKKPLGKAEQLFGTLLAGAELSFYVRQKPDPKKDKQLLYFLEEIHNYKNHK